MINVIIQNTLFGIVTGSILVVGTLGFVMTERLDGFINIGHGQFLAIGAYLTYWFCQGLSFSFVLSAIIAVLLTAIIALCINKVFFKPMHRFGVIPLIVTSIGLGGFLNGAVEFFGGPDPHSFNLSVHKVIKVSEISLLSKDFFYIILIGVVFIVIVHLFLQNTKIGKAFRAVSSNRELAIIKGIDLDFLSNYTWLFAGATGAIAGILLGVVGNLTPDMGWGQTMIIMSVAVVAGMGNVYGIMIASFIVGITMDLGILVFPSGYRPALAFAIMIIVLLIKPKGIFAK